ncbi:hypothetical protein [Alloalcanivorax xenomutans]|uniref:hypothetical protein n=1 Tax=Alloalcanivorax xenomutans TaxID=1094342 RepID=UPI003BA860CD
MSVNTLLGAKEIILESLALLISLFSFGLSGLAIYLAYFRQPALSAHVGPYIVAIYNNKGLTITVPTTVANQAHQVGVVRRCSLTLTRHDSRQKNYFMVWDSFRKITDDGATWVQVGTAHAIPVLGRSTKTHNIQYVWEYESSPELLLKAGQYDFRFDFWSEQETPFASVSHEMTVSEKDASMLQASLAQRNAQETIRRGVVYLTLDSETNRNRLLTEHEITKLL